MSGIHHGKTNPSGSRIGPPVCELLGPMPMVKSCNTLMAMKFFRAARCSGMEIG
jgi:hypothetical protein